jgi:hypothetical protein
MLALQTPDHQIQINGSLEALNLKQGNIFSSQSIALMGALCMLLLNYGTAFKLSYAQLLLFIPLDADLKHV